MMRLSDRALFASCVGVLALLVVGSVGCSQKYITPAAGVSMNELMHETDAYQRQLSIEQAEREKGTDRQIAKTLAIQPAAGFPAHVVVARLQSSGYTNRYTTAYGHGRYSVVTTRDVEPADAVTKLGNLPFMAQVSPMSRMVLPEELEGMMDLRQGAATLRADLLLIYTLDTRFRVKDHDVGPLNWIVLGNLRNQEAMVTTTASAAFLDVRTGYVYGTAEHTAQTNKKASIWGSRDAIDDARQKTEAEAFTGMVEALQGTWTGIVETYHPGLSSWRPSWLKRGFEPDVETLRGIETIMRGC